jgi:hypothetical protein
VQLRWVSIAPRRGCDDKKSCGCTAAIAQGNEFNGALVDVAAHIACIGHDRGQVIPIADGCVNGAKVRNVREVLLTAR